MQHVAEPLARALRPGGDDDALPGRLQVADMPDHGVEDVGALVGPLGGEVAAPPRPAIDDDAGSASGHGERRQTRRRVSSRSALGPLLAAEVERVRRQRLVGRDAGCASAQRLARAS